MLDRTGYLNDLRDENTEEANERIENLMELVSAAREYETREPEASLGGYRRSPVAAVGGRRRIRDARSQGLADDDARGQGARVPGRDHRRPGRGPVPALAIGRERGRARGGAAALLRRDDARREPAVPHRAPPGGACSANTRRRRRHGSSTRSRRSSSSASTPPPASTLPGQLRARALRVPDEPVRPQGTRRASFEEEPTSYAYEDEDQSAPDRAAGHARPARAVRRRHGPRRSRSTTTISRSPCASTRSGQKKLLAKFAKLEPA